jgi:gamma-glutamyl:cysteine ligase YbdK (ATP-grasp superfamily)
MGQEIRQSHFTRQDFRRFRARLRRETATLSDWFHADRFAPEGGVAGFEIEAWLVDRRGQPAPLNRAFLERLADPLVVPELSVFNIELNTPPLPLHGDVLHRMHANLESLWQRCQRVAADLDATVALIGILPTLRVADLTPDHMSNQQRYRAINAQILRRRRGRPMELAIHGIDTLGLTHPDVMLEAATTSFQIHLQYPCSGIRRIYNAAIMASAPLVAVSQNSPFLFARDLWGETRIALFEQSIPVGGFEAASGGPLHRVSFGSGYARACIGECFEENRDHFPVLLPICFDTQPEQFAHLKLHNGTIWRWNRPLVGLDPDGTAHVRVEHRAIPAGPTMIDTVANAAFYFGLVEWLNANEEEPSLPFPEAKDNFYLAAKNGLDAHVNWNHGEKHRMRHLVLKQLLPRARDGLSKLEVDEPDIDAYLGVIEQRVASGLTGAEWQRRFMRKHPDEFKRMTATYLENQLRGEPVHQWEID